MAVLDVRVFETGFNLYHIGGFRESRPRGFWLRRLCGLGGVSLRRSQAGLQFRATEGTVPSNFPRFRVHGAGHVGLLAVPGGMHEQIQMQYPDAEIRMAVIGRAQDGRALAGVLPNNLRPGAAKLRFDWQEPLCPKVLATPVPRGTAGNRGDEAEVETVFYQFSRRGLAPAALGFVVGGETLAMPRAVVNRPPANSMPLNAEVLGWARVSATPIV